MGKSALLHILVYKEKCKTKTSPEVRDCMLGCTPEIWYPSVLQAIVSTVWYSKALKFEILT